MSPARSRLDLWVTRAADPVLTTISRRWLACTNLLIAALVVGAFAAPVLVASGEATLANTVYDWYGSLCHQWAFRSLFLFGPRAIYGRDELGALGVDPFSFEGNAEMGWKMAFCERDLGIFVGLLVFGLLFAVRWRAASLQPSGYLLYAVLLVPMAVDGFTQLFGWRESTWELRLATGLLFGVSTGWLLYPRFQQSLDREI